MFLGSLVGFTGGGRSSMSSRFDGCVGSVARFEMTVRQIGDPATISLVSGARPPVGGHAGAPSVFVPSLGEDP